MRAKLLAFCILAILFHCQIIATETVGSPIRFTENKGQFINTDGQVAENVHFKAQFNGADLYLTNQGMSLVFVSETDPPQTFNTGSGEEREKDRAQNSEIRLYRLDMKLLGMDPNCEIEAFDPGIERDNYYLPHCSEGILGAKSYKKVVYRDIYPGIDWEIIAEDKGGFKTQFIVHPGADPSQIRMGFPGADFLSITPEQELMVKCSDGKLLDSPPVGIQGEQNIPIAYNIDLAELSFDIGDYDPTKSLVIDPYTRIYATFLGGSSSEWYLGHVVSTDILGYIFMAGHSPSTNFPTSAGAYQTSMAGIRDCFVSKFDTAGVRLFTTFIGGSSTEGGIAFKAGLCTDVFTNVWMASVTQSSNFPTTAGAFSATSGGGYDAVLTKFTNNGALLYSTYFGGSGSESNNLSRWGANSAPALATDGSGNIFMMGMTNSSNFPVTAGAFQTSLAGGYDAYLSKWTNTGNLLFATYYGGTSNEEAAACGVAVDQFGNAWMTGCTGSSNFPVTAGAFQTTFGGIFDQYLVKWSNTGTRLYSTYFGGTGDEGVLNDVDVAIGGDVWISSFTQSGNYPVTGTAYQPIRAGGWEIGMARFNNNGTLEYSSYYGSSAQEEPWDIAIDRLTGNVAISGCTWGNTWPTHGGPFQASSGGNQDGTILIMDSLGVPVYSTYYGSAGHDEAFSGIFDRYGNFWASGHCAQATFPVTTATAFQPTIGGSSDGFLVRFTPPVILDQSTLSLRVAQIDQDNKDVTLVWDYQGEPAQKLLVERNTHQGWEQIGEARDLSTFTDTEAMEGINHYRIKLIDQQGKQVLSHQVSAVIEITRDDILALYPNPLDKGGEIELTLQMVQDRSVRIEILDMRGKSLYQKEKPCTSGLNYLQIPTGNWSQGSYLLRVQSPSGPITRKFLIK